VVEWSPETANEAHIQLYPALLCIHCIHSYIQLMLYSWIHVDTATEHAFRIGCTLGVSVAIIWDDLALSLRNGKAVLRQIYARMPIATSLILRFIPRR
jgi:hypothetical protein